MSPDEIITRDAKIEVLSHARPMAIVVNPGRGSISPGDTQVWIGVNQATTAEGDHEPIKNPVRELDIESLSLTLKDPHSVRSGLGPLFKWGYDITDFDDDGEDEILLEFSVSPLGFGGRIDDHEIDFYLTGETLDGEQAMGHTKVTLAGG